MAERTLRVNIIGDERDLLRAFGSSARGSRAFEAQMTGVSRSVRNVFAAAGVALGATAIVQAFRSTISAAIDFESSFAGVRKTVDATEPQLRALARGFRELSKEIPVSVEELNKIGEAAGQLGIQRTAILDFTKVIAALGATTNLSADQAADALARIANIVQLPQNQFDELGSTVADLGNKLAATESEIVEFGTRIAAAGKIVGLSVDEVLAISGAFASVNVEAERGGTAVSKVFISLANAVATGGKQLQLFADTAGTSVAQFRQQFETDASAAFVAFVEGLKRVDDEGGNVFKTLTDLGLTDARLIQAFLSISQSGDLLNRSLAVGSRAWEENSALQEEAAKRYETTASKLQIFQNRVNDLQITLGNVLAPALLEIITPLGKWLESTENQERVQKALIQTMEDARSVFEGVRSVVQPLAEGVKSLADRMGGLNQAVKLLLITMVAAKVVGFGSAITGLGTAAAGTTTKVRLLQTALLRIGAIGVITLSIEFLTNYDEISAQFQRLTGLGREIPKEPEQALARLRKELVLVAKLFGQNSDEARKLQAEIAAVNKQLGLNPSAASLHDERQTDAAAPAGASRRGTERLGRDLDRAGNTREQIVKKFAARMARLGLELDKAGLTTSFADDLRILAQQEALVRSQIGIEGSTLDLERQLFEIERARLAIRGQQGNQAGAMKDALKQRIAEQREMERLQRDAQRQARIGQQFAALGLTSEGDQRAPGVGALRGRLANLREQLKGTPLDTDKTRSQLDQIAKVLKGKFGAVGRDVRLAILDMFNQIASGFKEGEKTSESLSSGGEITRGGIRSTQRLLRGLNLSDEERRLLTQRNLGVSGPRGQSAFGFALGGSTNVGTFGRPERESGGNIIVQNLTVVSNDPNDMMKKLQKKARRSSGGRRGRHGGANLGMQ